VGQLEGRSAGLQMTSEVTGGALVRRSKKSQQSAEEGFKKEKKNEFRQGRGKADGRLRVFWK